MPGRDRHHVKPATRLVYGTHGPRRAGRASTPRQHTHPYRRETDRSDGRVGHRFPALGSPCGKPDVGPVRQTAGPQSGAPGTRPSICPVWQPSGRLAVWLTVRVGGGSIAGRTGRGERRARRTRTQAAARAGVRWHPQSYRSGPLGWHFGRVSMSVCFSYRRLPSCARRPWFLRETAPGIGSTGCSLLKVRSRVSQASDWRVSGLTGRPDIRLAARQAGLLASRSVVRSTCWPAVRLSRRPYGNAAGRPA
ncbi:unnamed protein product [Gemmata massiliana]|uniref:Uncharacterized protein n=1 Tax=Gemmata massiliana TaxID=1210884 RepID=A0A6P2CT95_9BACT|nr:unnamed protein product [Gemmata massiliana]